MKGGGGKRGGEGREEPHKSFWSIVSLLYFRLGKHWNTQIFKQRLHAKLSFMNVEVTSIEEEWQHWSQQGGNFTVERRWVGKCMADICEEQKQPARQGLPNYGLQQYQPPLRSCQTSRANLCGADTELRHRPPFPGTPQEKEQILEADQ